MRRSYSYDRGDGDTGIIFSCFQRDLAKGFEAVQKRLEGEALAKYVLTTGGGYFFVPPPGDAWIDALGQRSCVNSIAEHAASSYAFSLVNPAKPAGPLVTRRCPSLRGSAG